MISVRDKLSNFSTKQESKQIRISLFREMPNLHFLRVLSLQYHTTSSDGVTSQPFIVLQCRAEPWNQKRLCLFFIDGYLTLNS